MPPWEPGPEKRPGRVGRGVDVLLDDVGKQAEEARALDRLGELALLLGRDRRDAARHDLAALRDVAGQELHVLVVDLRSVRAREWAGLATTEERTTATAATTSTKCHDLVLP